MSESYLRLCTEFYDQTKPEAQTKEVAFYEKLLRSAKGPILEAMCGSGRLLIPLRKKGLEVEGVDSSMHMLESCRQRCQQQGIEVQLYHQALQKLSLPKRYDVIFIAIGSFQLIGDTKEAISILENLRSALLPGGRIVLEIFVPWDSIKENIHGSVLDDQSKPSTFEKEIALPENTKIIHKSAVMTDFKKQIEVCQSRYEKWVNGSFSNVEEEQYTVRWYYRYEMELLLEKAGFCSIEIIDASFENDPQAIIYVGRSPKD